MATKVESLENHKEFLTFILGSEEYGVDILSVEGIQCWNGVTRVPDTPDFMLGVINIRGAIVPIIDLRVKFGLPSVEFNPTTVVVVLNVTVEEKKQIVGIVVDAVSEVYEFDIGEIQANPELANARLQDVVTGLISIEEKMVIILDTDLLLADEVEPELEAAA